MNQKSLLFPLPVNEYLPCNRWRLNKKLVFNSRREEHFNYSTSLSFDTLLHDNLLFVLKTSITISNFGMTCSLKSIFFLFLSLPFLVKLHGSLSSPSLLTHFVFSPIMQLSWVVYRMTHQSVSRSSDHVRTHAANQSSLPAMDSLTTYIQYMDVEYVLAAYLLSINGSTSGEYQSKPETAILSVYNPIFQKCFFFSF